MSWKPSSVLPTCRSLDQSMPQSEPFEIFTYHLQPFRSGLTQLQPLSEMQIPRELLLPSQKPGLELSINLA